MVINEASSPDATRQSKFDSRYPESEQYHVRQTMNQSEIETTNSTSSESEKKSKKKKYAKKRHDKSVMSTLAGSDDTGVTKISENDLEELRSVYYKCKVVMQKIETKYGHLLNLEDTTSRKRKEYVSDPVEINDIKCECTVNKKIVFDDDGKEITTETELGNHICVKKLKRTRSTDPVNINNVQIEYDAPDSTLPDDLRSLASILHNPEIEVTYRNGVISKMKMLKQEYLDEIRFNKHMLIEKLKTDPDEVLDFKGTNLKTLPGYIINYSK